MRVKTVTFAKTKQIQRFEPERIELVIELAEGESVQVAIEMARRTCNALLGEFPSEIEIEQARLLLANTEGPRFS